MVASKILKKLKIFMGYIITICRKFEFFPPQNRSDGKVSIIAMSQLPWDLSGIVNKKKWMDGFLQQFLQ